MLVNVLRFGKAFANCCRRTGGSASSRFIAPWYEQECPSAGSGVGELEGARRSTWKASVVPAMLPMTSW